MSVSLLLAFSSQRATLKVTAVVRPCFLFGPIMYARTHAQASEFVDDSEPERENLRQMQKMARKLKKEQKCQPDTGSVNVQVPTSSGTRHFPFHIRPKDDVIELTDSADESAADEPLPSLPVPSKDTRQAIPSRPAYHGNTSSTDIRHPKSPVKGPRYDDDGEFGIQVGRFAYSGDERVKRVKVNIEASVQSGSNAPSAKSTPEPIVKPARTRKTKARLAVDFSNAELASLSKCVSCQISWTVRKTVPQKINHIQTCAKKRGLTQDSLNVLLHRELEKSTPASSKTVSSAEQEPLTKTFVEEVVEDAVPKKRIRRPNVVGTVVGLSQTRTTILDRARSLIQGRQNSVEVLPEATQGFGPSNLASATEVATPPQTQPFRHSKLANGPSIVEGLITADASPNDSSESSDEESGSVPLATQTMVPSRLAMALLRDTGISTTSSTYSSAAPSVISISSSSTRHNFISAARPSSREHSPQRHSVTTPEDLALTRQFPHPSHVTVPHMSMGETASHAEGGEGQEVIVTDNVSHEWSDNDAYMHFEPDLNTMSSFQHHPRVSRSLPPIPSQDNRDDNSPAPSQHDLAGRKMKKVRSSKGKGKVKDGVIGVMDDTAFASQFRELILADAMLHLRILRYEPIDFQVFMAIAESLGVSNRGLKLKVRGFLDQHAINFYGAEPGGTRTRKRHP